MAGCVLIVDDEPLKRISLQIELTEHGYEVYEAADAAAARRILDSRAVDVMVSDVRMPGMSGLDLLTEVKQQRPDVDVILMTAYATVESAVLAIKRGAHDYITKPFTTTDLVEKLGRLFAARPVRAATSKDPVSLGPVVARSASLRRLLAQLRDAAADARPVLLVGEPGVGKRVLAEALHTSGPAAAAPLDLIDCRGPGESELASVLFPPPADARRRDAAADSAAGTLIVAHVEALPRALQARLARELEHSGGGSAPRRRIVATACEDPRTAVDAGRFEPDLYYRLGVLRFDVPPLRQRPDDIPILAAHFLERHAAMAGGATPRLSSTALDELTRHDWPGNARELEHVLERATVMCRGDEVRPEHVLPLGTRASDVDAGADPRSYGDFGAMDLVETVAQIERRLIIMALKQCNQNQARAAQKLGIPRTTLRDKMAKYEIPAG